MKKLTFAAALVAATISAPALASENPLYLAVDAGQSTYGGDASTICNAVAGLAGTSCSKTDTAIRIAGGYTFSRNFGMEVSYTDYGKASITATAPGAALTASAKTTALQIVGTGSLPLSDSFALTAKVGLAAATVDANFSAAAAGIGAAAGAVSASNNNLVWGIGAQFDVTPTIGLRLNYEDLGNVGDSLTTGKYKLSAITGGVVVKF